MLLDHVFITYSDNAYNPATKSYEPIDQRILVYTKDSLVFDLNRRTIYAQGLEFGKHHHTTLNKWDTSIIYDFVENEQGGAKKSRSAAEYSIIETKIQAKNPKKIVNIPESNMLFMINQSNEGIFAYIDDSNDTYDIIFLNELDTNDERYEAEIPAVEDAITSGHLLIIKTYYNIQNSSSYDSYKLLFFGINSGYLSCPEIRTVNNIQYDPLLSCATICGDNWGTGCCSIVTDGDGQHYFNANSPIKILKTYLSPTRTFAISIIVDGYSAYAVKVDLPSYGHTINSEDYICKIDEEDGSSQQEFINDILNKFDIVISPDGLNACLINYVSNSIYDLYNFDYNDPDSSSLININNYSISSVQFINNISLLANYVTTEPVEVRGATVTNSLNLVNVNNGTIMSSKFNGNVYAQWHPSYQDKVVVVQLSEYYDLELAKSASTSAGDAFIWDIANDIVSDPICNIRLKNYNAGNFGPEMEMKGATNPNIPIDETPDIKITSNEDGTLFAVIDELGNLYVFNEDGNMISENLSTDVNEAHWFGNSLIVNKKINVADKPVIVDVNLDLEGTLTYQVANLSMGSGTHINTFNNSEYYLNLIPGRVVNLVNGINQSANGQVTYSYEHLRMPYLTVAKGTTTNHNAYSIVGFGITNSSDTTTFSYTYADLKSSASDGSYLGAYNVNSPTSYLRVITGIEQQRDGKISYSYQSIYTNHGGKVQINPGYDKDFISMVQLSANGQLTGSFGEFTNQRIGNTTSGVVTYVHLAHEGKLKFAYTSLSDLLNVTQTSEDQGNKTLQDNTSYQVITNISQNANGSISYSYANFNTTHTNNNNTVTGAQSHVVTNVHLDADGNFSYDTKALSHSVVSTGSYTINNGTGSPEFIYGLTQAADGTISYSTHKLKTNISHSSDNVAGVVYEVNVDANGQTISYAHKNLTTNSGVSNGTKKLLNDSSYQLVTGITQNAYGKISYSYITLQNTLFDFTNDGTTNGVLTNVNIDSTGKLSYDSVNLTTDSGIYSDKSYSTGVKVATAVGSSNLFISGISQDANGKISYTYSGIYTDKTDYDYHTITLTQHDLVPDIAAPLDNQIPVIYGISTTNSGSNTTTHTISYQTAYVPTKKYVDGLIAANDALRYAGTIVPATTPNGAVTFPNVSDPDYSCGAVYKVNGNGYFGTQYVTSGDMIISYSDSAFASSFSDWNVINNNVDLRTNDNVNAKNIETNQRVLTNVYLNDAGLLSYTSYSLGVQNVSTDDNGSNDLLGSTYDVITGVKIEQDGLDTKLSYTYTTIKVNQAHHSTSGNSTTHPQSITYVWLDDNGQLTYSAEDLSSSSATQSDKTLGTAKTLVISNISQAANGKISYTAYALNTTHSTINNQVGGASMVIGSVNLSAEGLLTYSYTDIAQIAYHYNVSTTVNGSGNVIKSIEHDSKGHVTKVSYMSVATTDEHVITKIVEEKYYITGKHFGDNYDVPNHEVSDDISYIENGHFYTDSADINKNVNIGGLLYVRDEANFDDDVIIKDKLHVGNDVSVGRTLAVVGVSYLNGNTYIGDASNDLAYIKSKNINFNDDNPIDFTHLKALWGVVGS